VIIEFRKEFSCQLANLKKGERERGNINYCQEEKKRMKNRCWGGEKGGIEIISA